MAPCQHAIISYQYYFEFESFTCNACRKDLLLDFHKIGLAWKKTQEPSYGQFLTAERERRVNRAFGAGAWERVKAQVTPVRERHATPPTR